MITAELQYSEEGQVVSRHEQLVHVGVGDVNPAEVRVLDEEQENLGAHSRYQHVALLARVQRCCKQCPVHIASLHKPTDEVSFIVRINVN